MKYIKLTKITESSSPLCKTPSKEDYKYGQDNGNVSVPLGYCIEGFLLHDVEVGKIIQIDRRIRNGEAVRGLFESSTVQKFENNVAETYNSKYLVEVIN